MSRELVHCWFGWCLAWAGEWFLFHLIVGFSSTSAVVFVTYDSDTSEKTSVSTMPVTLCRNVMKPARRSSLIRLVYGKHGGGTAAEGKLVHPCSKVAHPLLALVSVIWLEHKVYVNGGSIWCSSDNSAETEPGLYGTRYFGKSHI